MKLHKLLPAMLLALLVVTACQKEEEDPLEDGTEVRDMAVDAYMYQNETELLFNDVSLALQGSALGKTITIDGATVNDSTFIGIKRIVLTYNGNTQDGKRTRTGSMIIQLTEGNKWRDEGAVAKIDFMNVRIRNNHYGFEVSVAGTFYIRNVSGGRAFIDAMVIHKVWGTGLTTFGSGRANEWQINRKRTFTNNAGVLGIESRGDTTVANKPNTIIWGVSRMGKSFWIQTPQSVVVSSLCTGKVMSGTQIISGVQTDITVTHGVNENGNPTTSGCPFGYKLSWATQKGDNKTAVVAY